MPETASALLSFLEKQAERAAPEPERKKRSALEKFLAPLTFPERMSAALVRSAYQDTGVEGFQENVKNYVDASTIVDDLFPEASRPFRIGASFAIGLAIDPLTYIGGIGGLTKAGKVAQLSGKAASGQKFTALRKVLDKASGNLVDDYIEVPFKNLTRAEQGAKGYRQLFNVKIPLVAAGWGVQEPLAVSKAMTAAGEALSKTKLVQRGRRFFVTSSGNPHMDDMKRAIDADVQALFRTATVGKHLIKGGPFARGGEKLLGVSNRVEALAPEMAKYARSIGKNPEDVAFEMSEAIELGRISSLSPDMQKFANEYVKINKEVFDIQAKFLDPEQLSELILEEGGVIKAHVPHVATKTGRQFLNTTGRLDDAKLAGTAHPGMARRGYRDETIFGLNERFKSEQGFGEYAKSIGSDEKMWMDPLSAQQVNIQRAIKAIGNKRFQEAMIEHAKKSKLLAEFESGSKYIRNPKGDFGFRKLSAKELAKVVDGKLGDLPVHTATETGNMLIRGKDKLGVWATGGVVRVMDKDIAAEMTKMVNIANSDEPLNALISAFDSTQNWWKAWTLGVFPSYHMRNLVDDTFRNTLVGVNPKDYQESFRLSNALTEAGGDISKLADPSDRLILQEALKRGVFDEGMWSREVDQLLKEVTSPAFGPGSLKAKTGKALSGTSPLVGLGNKIGRFRENRWRFANFISQTRQGMKMVYGENLQGLANRLGKDESVVNNIFDHATKMVEKVNFNYGKLTDAERKFAKRLLPFYSFSRNNLPFQLENLLQQPGTYAAIDKGRRAFDPKPGEGSDQKYLSDFIKDNYPVFFGKDDEGIERYALFNSYLSATDLIRFLNPENAGNEAWGMLSPLPKELMQQMFNYDPFFRSAIQKYPGEQERFLNIVMPKKISHVLKNVRIMGEADRIIKSFTEDYGINPYEAGLRYLTGFKLYPQDPVRAMAFYEYEIEKAISQRKAALRRIVKKAQSGRMDAKYFQKESQLLLKQIEELQSRPENIE